MPKEFFTEVDIENLAKRGVMSLEVTEDVVLTELAYEKARRLGVQLIQKVDTPPSAPIRPYLSKAKIPASGSAPSGTAAPRMTAPPDFSDLYRTPAGLPSVTAGAKVNPEELRQRIRSAVTARLGGQVDAALLDAIINRVLKSTGIA